MCAFPIFSALIIILSVNYSSSSFVPIQNKNGL
jgi:hypothetical protein